MLSPKKVGFQKLYLYFCHFFTNSKNRNTVANYNETFLFHGPVEVWTFWDFQKSFLVAAFFFFFCFPFLVQFLERAIFIIPLHPKHGVTCFFKPAKPFYNNVVETNDKKYGHETENVKY